MEKRNTILLIIFTLSIFLEFWMLEEIPPPHQDELELGMYSIFISLKGITNEIISPTFHLPYSGPLVHYIFLPFIKLIGISIFSIRLSMVIIGISFSLLLFFLVKDIYDWETAIFSYFVLILSPPFLTYSRMGLEVILLPFFTLLVIFFLRNYEKTGKAYFLYLSSFLGGLGLLIRLDFIYFIFFLMIYQLIGNSFPKVRISSKKCGAISLFLFLLGGYLFFYYHIINSFPVLRITLETFPLTHLKEVNLLDIKSNLLLNFFQIFPNFCRGSLFTLQYTSPNHFLIFSIIGLLFLVYQELRDARLSNKDFNFFILFFCTSIFLLNSVLTPSHFSEDHYIFLLPFFTIGIGKFFREILRKNIIIFSFLFSLFLIFSVFHLYEFFSKKTSTDYTNYVDLPRKIILFSLNESYNIVVGYKAFGAAFKWISYTLGKPESVFLVSDCKKNYTDLISEKEKLNFVFLLKYEEEQRCFNILKNLTSKKFNAKVRIFGPYTSYITERTI